MRFVVRTERLSDDSTVYNVVALVQGRPAITFGAASREHAARLINALDDAAWIDIDPEVAALHGYPDGDGNLKALYLKPVVIPEVKEG